MKWKKCFENINVSVVVGYMDVEVYHSFYLFTWFANADLTYYCQY